MIELRWLPLCLVLMTFGIHAASGTQHWGVRDGGTDVITDERTIGAYSSRNKHGVGLECRYHDSEAGSLWVVYDAGEIFAPKNSRFAAIIRVDKNKPFELGARAYGNSGEAGYSLLSTLGLDQELGLLQQLISGDSYAMRLTWQGASYTKTGSLSGSKVAIATVLQTCQYENIDALSELVGIDLNESVEKAELGNTETSYLFKSRERYIRSVQQAVRNRWINATGEKDFTCVIRVNQDPAGGVLFVQVLPCDVSTRTIRSIENAVLKASPLPKPPDRRLYERVLEIEISG